MKNECDIVGDLLFSYNDGILSDASKKLVEEHLDKCEKCKKILEEIKQENDKKNQIKEINSFKNIKKCMNKRNIIILVVVIILMIFVLINIQVYNNYNEIASTMEVYLKDDITDEQIENIKNKIIEKSDNIEMEYVSKEKALERLKNKLEKQGNDSNILNHNNPIPASIEIKTNTKIETIVESIQDMPGIVHIKTYINSNPYELYIQKIWSILFDIK